MRTNFSAIPGIETTRKLASESTLAAAESESLTEEAIGIGNS